MRIDQIPHYPTSYSVDLTESVNQRWTRASNSPIATAELAVSERPHPASRHLPARLDGLAGGFDSLLAQNFRPSRGPTVRPGVDQSIFRYKRNDSFDRPNTAVPYIQPVDPARLRIEHGKALVTAAGAGVAGFPLAGELLMHYLNGTGAPVELSVSRVGGGFYAEIGSDAGGEKNIIKSHYKPTSELRQQLDQRVKSYFDQHPQATTVTATSDWVSSRAANNEDSFRAINFLYSSLRGVFVKRPNGRIEGRIQAVGYDYYDFHVGGMELPTPFGPVAHVDLYHMANPKVGLAKSFDVWITGPVLPVRLSK